LSACDFTKGTVAVIGEDRGIVRLKEDVVSKV